MADDLKTFMADDLKTLQDKLKKLQAVEKPSLAIQIMIKGLQDHIAIIQHGAS